MTATYDCIATTTLANNTSTVAFTSIPGTYTDLVLVTNLKYNTGTTGIQELVFTINGDSGSNYSVTVVYYTPGSARRTNETKMLFSGGAGEQNVSYFPMVISHFMNYSNTNTFKTILARGVNSLNVGLWRSTSAITSITIDNSRTYLAGSVLSLYGIKAE